MKKRRGRGEGGLEQLPNGHWRAVVCRTVNGKRVRSSKTFPLKREATDWRDSQKGLGPTAAGTLGEWLDTWLTLHKAAVSATNYATDRQTIERHVRPGLGAVRLRDLSGLVIARWLADLDGTGVSRSERHKCGRTVRKVARAAHANGMLAAVPKFMVPGRPRPKTHSLTRDELASLKVAADAAGLGVLVRVWADAGLRPGELLGLRWGDWDAARRRLTVRRAVCRETGRCKDTKTGRVRTVLLSRESAAHLGQIPAGDPESPIFPAAQGGHWRTQNFATKRFRPLARAAGVKVTPYTLRHTCATLLLQAGVSLKVVSERLGHDNVETTLRSYAHVLPGDQERAADAMDEILSSPPDPHTAGVNGRPNQVK